MNRFLTDFLIFAPVIDIVRRERVVHYDEIHKFAQMLEILQMFANISILILAAIEHWQITYNAICVVGIFYGSILMENWLESKCVLLHQTGIKDKSAES